MPSSWLRGRRCSSGASTPTERRCSARWRSSTPLPGPSARNMSRTSWCPGATRRCSSSRRGRCWWQAVSTGPVHPSRRSRWFLPDVTGPSKQPYDLRNLGAVGPAQAYVTLPGQGAPSRQKPACRTGAGARSRSGRSPREAHPSRDHRFRAPSLKTPSSSVERGARPSSGPDTTGCAGNHGRAFGPLDVLDAKPANVGDATCSPDPGMALWLYPSGSDAGGGDSLTALRFDTTNVYSPLGETLLMDATSLAPDQFPGPLVASFLEYPALTPQGALDLGPGVSAFVTDFAAYEDVAIDVTMRTTPAALVVLRDAHGQRDARGCARLSSRPVRPFPGPRRKARRDDLVGDGRGKLRNVPGELRCRRSGLHRSAGAATEHGRREEPPGHPPRPLSSAIERAPSRSTSAASSRVILPGAAGPP